jgi:hypothetical protein
MPFSKDAVAVALLVVFFAFLFGLLYEIPGLLRRGFAGIPLLLLGAVVAPLIADQLGAPLWVLLVAAGGFGSLALALRNAVRCPRCKKPLKMGTYYFFSAMAVTGGSHDMSFTCLWCGYAVLAGELRGNPFDALRESERKYDLTREWRDKCLWVELRVAPLGLEADFLEWWEFTHRGEPVPDDFLKGAEIVNAYLRSKGLPQVTDNDAWRELLKRRDRR